VSRPRLTWLALQTVQALDDYIVGQADAKRAIAIALRNRWRRQRVDADIKDDIIPKNILMVGPTGVGKTEIARRLARFASAPFVKVEATKFTEVGYHGRDVDSIIKDLVEASAKVFRDVKKRELQAEIALAVDDILLNALAGEQPDEATRTQFLALLRDGDLEDMEVEVNVPKGAYCAPACSHLPPCPPARRHSPPTSCAAQGDQSIEFSMGGSGQTVSVDPSELFSKLNGQGGRRSNKEMRRLKVKDARPQLLEAELDARLADVDWRKESVNLAEQHGIVFIDEIDKIVTSSTRMYKGADASAEGVQRDLLPLIEGTTIDVKKFGPVRTDYVLFVASGAFSDAKPSDMLAELQGRLPIRVELQGLTADDMYRILTEPKNNLLKQQQALLGAEGVTLQFTDDAVRELAERSADMNKTVENIGARRLHTVLERVMDDLSFEAAAMEPGTTVTVDGKLVKDKLDGFAKRTDLKKFIL